MSWDSNPTRGVVLAAVILRRRVVLIDILANFVKLVQDTLQLASNFLRRGFSSLIGDTIEVILGPSATFQTLKSVFIISIGCVRLLIN